MTQKTIVFESGERFPILVSSENGMPHFLSTVFLAQNCRGKASNTMRAIAHAIIHLHLWARSIDLNIYERFSANKFLTMSEVESLASAFRLKTSLLRQLSSGEIRRASGRWFPKSTGKHAVSPQTIASRMRYAETYLSYIAKNYIHEQALNGKNISEIHTALEIMQRGILSRVPPVGKRAQIHMRRGLSKDEERTMLQIVHPESSLNPWNNNLVKHRNFLLVSILLNLGIRVGEALGLKIRDFDFRLNRVKVLRRPDDPVDSRPEEPNTKTFDRVLLMGPELALLVHKFILLRGRHRASKVNDFLFTSLRNGAPLSYDTVFCAFKSIKRSAGNELPRHLCAHSLRHTWNDRFSEYAEANGLSSTEEEKIRSYLCGWREASGTAAVYTKRYQKKRADEVSLKLQRGFVDV